MGLCVMFLFSAVLLNNYCNGALVTSTWRFAEATEAAWAALVQTNDAIDAIEAGCSYCESHQCGLTVGFGGSPDESGETTLDALIFDGRTMNAGGVGNLRRVKNAISVAKHVLQHTEHSLMTGNQATAFAVSMGFEEESLSTNVSTGIWEDWKANNCQPNFWKNVEPDPNTSCGPYTPVSQNSVYYREIKNTGRLSNAEINHDTIGMIVLDGNRNIVGGTSTNGLRYKIPGRVGDSPIPGAGAYADNAVGAACATGNGDVMMRFLPSFLAVEKMREGYSASEAAEIAVKRIVEAYPDFSGAVIAVTIDGEYGAACNGMAEFPFSVRNDESNEAITLTVNCVTTPQN